jgi:hypothetical protein
MIEDLAVENDGEPSAPGAHRLMTVRGEIHDRQPPETQRDAGGGLYPNAAVIGPAMRDCVRHSRSDRPHLVGSAISS